MRSSRRIDHANAPTVIKAYAISLRVTFLSCTIFAIVLCLLVLPVSIPDLPETDPRRSSVGSETDSLESEGRDNDLTADA